MSMRSLEAEILAELRAVTGKMSLRQKDIMEWSTTKLEPQEGETLIHLSNVGAWVCYAPKKK